jgi:hypothetical protein
MKSLTLKLKGLFHEMIVCFLRLIIINRYFLYTIPYRKLSWPEHTSDNLYTVFYLSILILCPCVAARKPPAQAGVEEGWWYSPEPDLPTRGFYLQQGHPVYQGKDFAPPVFYSLLV